MSHFTVLVIGDDWEGLLAPYSEDLEVEPYKDYAELGTDGYEGRILADMFPDVDRTDFAAVADVLSRYEDYQADDLGVFKMSTYNPRSKWDWYTLGGRWTGHWPLKAGADGSVGRPGTFGGPAESGTADQCRKDAIDFERKSVEAGAMAGEQWDQFAALREKHGPALSWREILDTDDIDGSRTRYWSQPLVKALRGARLPGLDDFLPTRESHVLLAMRSACVTFALLTPEGWAEKGRMGWFGMTADLKEDGDWNDMWWRIVESAPDDALFSVVDCHI